MTFIKGVHHASSNHMDGFGENMKVYTKLIKLPYSRKIWRELNLAKSPKTAKIKYWRNLNLAIVYGEGYDVINYFSQN